MVCTGTALKKLSALCILVFLYTESVIAFPEMIKHGYVNCTACHISPAGGGLLNSYGRNLSAELISSHSYKGEEGFLHGYVNTAKVDDWLAIGGDIRGIQVHTDYTEKSTGTNTVSGRWINMQFGLEVGLIQPDWALVVAVGEYNYSDRNHKNEILLNSPKHYALYKPTDEISLKLGKFQPNFGLNLPDHIFSTRAGLGLGYIIDKHTLEVSYMGENWNFIGSGYNIPSRFNSVYKNGFVANVMHVLQDKYKFGLQVLAEKGDTQKRNIIGLTGQLGWDEKLVSLFEIDRITTKPDNAVETKGLALIHRTQYEIFKGFNVAVLNDYGQTNLDIGSTKTYRLGPGVIWYPRPHFDFQIFGTREYRDSLSEPGTFAWLMTHYYF